MWLTLNRSAVCLVGHITPYHSNRLPSLCIGQLWARDHMGWNIRSWKRVHWSDESYFCRIQLMATSTYGDREIQHFNRNILGVIFRERSVLWRSFTLPVSFTRCFNRTMTVWLTLNRSAVCLVGHITPYHSNRLPSLCISPTYVYTWP
jgi:hypothetical protein